MHTVLKLKYFFKHIRKEIYVTNRPRDFHETCFNLHGQQQKGHAVIFTVYLITNGLNSRVVKFSADNYFAHDNLSLYRNLFRQHFLTMPCKEHWILIKYVSHISGIFAPCSNGSIFASCSCRKDMLR